METQAKNSRGHSTNTAERPLPKVQNYRSIPAISGAQAAVAEFQSRFVQESQLRKYRNEPLK